ncbi:MAG: sel1 repeat family protein [Proteobacteria bacterium]|nr:sel1 repeat family protein [Pseudomonadota bacterium]
MTRLIRCIEGHVYDADEHTTCPRCSLSQETEAQPVGSSVLRWESHAAPGRFNIRWLAIGASAAVCLAGIGYWKMHRTTPEVIQEETQKIVPPAVPTAPAKPILPPASPQPVAHEEPPAPPPPQQSEHRAWPDNPPLTTLPVPQPLDKLSTQSAPEIVAALGSAGPLPPELLMLARYALGVGLIDHGKLDVGLPLIKQAAEYGVARAQTALGHGYLTGSYGLQKDLPAARRWLQKAAIAGEPEAAYELSALEFGDPSPQGKAAAREHFLVAYFANFPLAFQLMGKARRGDAEASKIFQQLNLDPARMPLTVPFLFATQRRSNPEQTRDQLNVFSQRVAIAKLYLATMMRHGEGGTQDKRAAQPLFLQAAEAGYTAGLIYAAEGKLDSSVGQVSHYEAIVLLAIGHAFPTGVITGINPLALYEDTLRQLPLQQSAAVKQFQDALRSVAMPGSILATHKE